ncbi:hypothetical protein MTR67_017887 [Solanum verrucosum]|uniref:NADH-ubiquinone oxidoreductase chain 4 n=1 Tax=Solanum verrucosum TaxID=315347 RepID=A0AAF0TL48_SOLVR|nr:hypothetical protein MTR67_017887 [Solanum verrucosum]
MGAVERFHIAETKYSTYVFDRSMSYHLVPVASKSTYALCSGSLIKKIVFGVGVYKGIGGSILPMSSHGLVSSALFLCVGVLYDRHKTRLVRYYRGSVSTMSNLSTIFFSSTLANMSSPGTSSFLGEFLILVGAFERNSLVATLAAVGMILGATYYLCLYNRAVSGNLKPDFLHKFSDPNGREVSIFIPFLVGGATGWGGLLGETNRKKGWGATMHERININLSEYEEESEIVVRSLSSNPQMCIFECFSRSLISQYQYFGCSSRYSYLKIELTKRLFTEIVVVFVVARISHDWVGVKSIACLTYALHKHLNVQDKKNDGKNRRVGRRQLGASRARAKQVSVVGCLRSPISSAFPRQQSLESKSR